jgi:hypothetical protein|tara:strand:+ start:388 stop:516 length:129 start_codon:yes stop_codon:yes gene_type:complete
MSSHAQRVVVLVDALVRYLNNHSESSNALPPPNPRRRSIGIP